ncbi:hypothetical protein HCN51_36375 [Nonomuraea sp. FMUSA5-5]|uniref:Secreted protein n=1 Tax=Nonomuraea composti TaxID=2720023 RepID=A0ABX1BED0_9ACTN|nr:hypothetical protein [Nonomuraea sp. FMUSA5-5]NJP94852.1 hypothetical protein [Nonomuraea sp. FMUSA5-5]
MSAIKRFTAALATVAALAAAGALTAGPASASDRTFGACAELETTGYGYAWVSNDCDYTIQGTVVLMDGTSLQCLSIPRSSLGISRGFRWDRPVRADYAKDCPQE